jgi:hypothetical protein
LLRGKALALVYLARGAGDGYLERFQTFVQSYKSFPAGIEHQLVIIFKGFKGAEQLRDGLRVFSSLDFVPVHTTDLTFDIGAYLDAAKQIDAQRICLLNTNSEIIGHDWLAKLSNNLDLKDVGIVGATGSFESLKIIDRRFPDFPNVHIRSNAFMIQRELLVDILSSYSIRTKVDAWFAESGEESITRRVFRMGRTALIVGRDGRGYHPNNWPRSLTYRQVDQSNLLVKDNVTRAFDQSPWEEKKELSFSAWGNYIGSAVVEMTPEAQS